mmetsp:Transcript_52150/g.134518  ORF Transcript_52150/g.134518 Transcript_52150/m.134518 type:complete len:256 (-) Transcript_52150:351-1118(-)
MHSLVIHADELGNLRELPHELLRVQRAETVCVEQADCIGVLLGLLRPGHRVLDPAAHGQHAALGLQELLQEGGVRKVHVEAALKTTPEHGDVVPWVCQQHNDLGVELRARGLLEGVAARDVAWHGARLEASSSCPGRGLLDPFAGAALGGGGVHEVGLVQEVRCPGVGATLHKGHQDALDAPDREDADHDHVPGARCEALLHGDHLGFLEEARVLDTLDYGAREVGQHGRNAERKQLLVEPTSGGSASLSKARTA